MNTNQLVFEITSAIRDWDMDGFEEINIYCDGVCIGTAASVDVDRDNQLSFKVGPLGVRYENDVA